MRQYAIKRIGLFIPTVLLVTVIVFVVMRLIPGDPGAGDPQRGRCLLH